jgi:hypothetical protein
MSTVEDTEKRTVRTEKQYSLAVQQAVIAAHATGMTLEQCAQAFEIHRNTVQRWCRDVRRVENPANPLASDYKPGLRAQAVQAITRGLTSKRDPYRAADIGVKVMTGIGEFQSKVDVDHDIAITVNWGHTQQAPHNKAQHDAQCIDVSPLESPDTT